jgi:hypothetical protein
MNACEGCGKELVIVRNGGNKKRFCTRKCWHRNYGKLRREKGLDWKPSLEYVRAGHRRRKYGLNEASFSKVLDSQKGLCALCELPLGTSIAVDHDHSCCPGKVSCGKCVRGLLHIRCNGGLGMFDDNPEICRKAAAYLERTSK